jgi:hypothetical protein
MMTSPELDRLVSIGTLAREPAAAGEVSGLRRSGEARLTDASKPTLALESRFDLAYNGAHSLALAALRKLGYRPRNRYLVFQVLTHTLSIPASTWRVLAKAHEVRNRAEYEGTLDIDERLVEDTIAAATAVLHALQATGPGAV